MQTTSSHHPTDELTAAESDCLRLIAGRMIPPSAEFSLPGADDPEIVAKLQQWLDRDKATVRSVLARVAAEFGTSPNPLRPADQAALIERLRGEFPHEFSVLEAVIARAYYSDDRVLSSIGMEPRAPFPLGFKIEEESDWSILEPVKQRGPIFRKLPT